MRAIEPALRETSRLRIDLVGALHIEHLDAGALDHLDRPLPAFTVHRVAQVIARVHSGSNYFSDLGSRLPGEAWPSGIMAGASSLGAYLMTLCLETAKLGTFLDLSLSVGQGFARLGQPPGDRPLLRTPHLDAFIASFVLARLRQSLGRAIHPREVTVYVSDPKLLVTPWRALGALPSGGFAIRFPAGWLTLPSEARRGAPPATLALVRGPGIEAPKVVLNCISVSDRLAEITPQEVADLCGLTLRDMNDTLGRYGTSVSDLIDRTKCDHALQAVLGSGKSLTEIGTDLGYSSVATFSRSFKRWTGICPRDYRRQHHDARPADPVPEDDPVETAT